MRAGAANQNATNQNFGLVMEDKNSYNREIVKGSLERTKRVAEHTQDHTKVLVKHGKCYVLKDCR